MLDYSDRGTPRKTRSWDGPTSGSTRMCTLCISSADRVSDFSALGSAHLGGPGIRGWEGDRSRLQSLP